MTLGRTALSRTIALFVLILAAAGCASRASRPVAGSPPPASGAGALAVATGPRGGIYAEFGQGLARLTESVPDAALRPRVTRGGAENLALLGRGEVQLAIVNMGTAYEAWTGAGPWAGTAPMAELRAVAPLYPIPFQLVVLADSGIAAFRDLDRRRVAVAVGPAKGPSELMFRALAADTGIAPVVSSDTPSLLAEQLTTRAIDAIWLAGELPSPVVGDLARAARIRLVPLGQDEARALLARFPALTAYSVPGRTYAGQAEPVASVALWNYLVALSSLPERTAYSIARSVMDRRAPAAAGMPAAWDPAGPGPTSFLPLHAGTARWLSEPGSR